jgi:hypothetical protein
MGQGTNPPGGTDDEHYPSDVDIVAMTIRHGADHTKWHLGSLARPEFYEEAESLGRLAADLPKEPQAEVIPFPRARERQP